MLKAAEGDEAMAITGAIAIMVAISLEPAALAAAYVLPPEDPTAALHAVAERLSHLDFESGLNQLPVKKRKLVDQFIATARPLYAEYGAIMETVLGAYARNEYDLSANPNDLILDAERVMPHDISAAMRLVGRAGAMGLRGKRWWWRWSKELAPPLDNRIDLAGNFIDDVLAGEPLRTVEEERAEWHTAAQDAPEPSSDDSDIAALDEELAVGDQLESLIDRLYNGEDALTQDLEQAFAARRDQAIPLLIDLAEDLELWDEESPGEGWVPIHAVELLGKLKAREAVPTLIDTIAASESGEIIRDQAMFALEAIGAPAAPAVLDTLRYSRNRELKADLASILGKIGRGRAGTFDALVKLYKELKWGESRIFTVMGMADLGDRRAIPILEQALTDPALPKWDRDEVNGALEELGARPQARPPRPTIVLPPLRAHPAKLGRNDPCWCGSGKKYKHCHLASDQEKADKGSPP